MSKKRTVKTEERSAAAEPKSASPHGREPKMLTWLGGAVLALIAAWAAYSPALNGEFLFDDIALAFRAVPSYASWSIAQATGGVRPLTELSYYFSFHAGGGEPFAFHFSSLLLHVGSAVLLAYVLRRLLTLLDLGAGLRTTLSVLGGGIFLLHPAQTEAVAYITSHSETLSVFFYLAALAVFLSGDSPRIGWGRSLGTLALFVLAMLSKEHSLTLPIVLVLLHLWVYRVSVVGLLKDGWRLYAPILAGAAFGVAVVAKTLAGAQTAGFGMADLTWWEYLLTQGRAIVLYLRLYLLPVQQSGDYLFPISRGPFEYGAIFYWMAIAGCVVAALWYRKRVPMLSLGVLLFLILLGPTSSILPIQDAAVERRVYLSSIGLVVATIGVFARWRPSLQTLRYGGAALLLLLLIATFQRSQVWASSDAFWEDVLAKNPDSWRANVQVGLKALEAGRCPQALELLERAQGKVAQNFQAAWHMNYARALSCVGREEEAEKEFRTSLAVEENAATLTQFGVFYGKQQRYGEALEALSRAIERSPQFPLAYSNRGNVYARLGNCAAAIPDFQTALRLMPSNTTAQRGLAYCQAQSGR